MIKQLFLTAFFALVFSATALAQNRTVSGTVTGSDDGLPLPQVSVLLKGTTTGVPTNIDGEYQISVPEAGGTLVFSFLGYVTQEVEIGNRTVIDVVLEPDATQLDEVVVVGYGSVKKSDLTGSVASVSSEELQQLPALRVDDVLQGRAPGLQITSTGSQPGSGSTIRIRGSNSLNGSNEPLFVIDGIIGGIDLNSINSADIESIEILKDASATAIYGSRGSNGVIIITTKKGSKGQGARLSYNSYVVVQSAVNRPVLPSGPEAARIANQIAEFTNPKNPEYDPKFDPGKVDINALPTTDWWNELTREAIQTNHTLSVAGGGTSSNYYFSGNIFEQQGLYKDNELKRYQFRASIDQEIDERIKIGFNSQISRVNIDEIGITPGFLGINYNFSPFVPVYNKDGSYAINPVVGATDTDNPVAEQNQVVRENFTTTILGSAYGQYEFFKGLTYKFSLGYSRSDYKRGEYIPNTLTEEARNRKGTAQINTSNSQSILLENTLNYALDIGADRLDLLGGYTRQTFSNESFNARAIGFVTNVTSYHNLQGGATRDLIQSSRSEAGLESWLFRANYSLNNEFLFTASARADAASQFAPNHKWATFPSAAIAWKADKYLPSDLMTGKLRLSYGSVGNVGIARFSSLARVGQRDYLLGTPQKLVIGFGQNSLPNPNLKWETTTQFNTGVDLDFFNGRIGLTVDYYHKITNDLIAGIQVPASSGANSFLVNLGSMKNSGMEFLLSTVNIDNPDGLRWSTDFNLSFNRNEVVKIDNEQGFVYTNDGFLGAGADQPTGIIQEGKPIGLFYGYVADGLWNTQAEIDAFPGNSADGKQLGGVRYRDLNGDGKVDDKDRKIIGDANPDFFGGIGNTLGYKNFELSFFLQFVVGNDILNFARRDNSSLTSKDFLNMWSLENKEGTIPRGGTTNFTPSTNWIEDGSYLRLQTLNLSYNVPVNNFTSFVSSLQFYFAASNLFTVTGYRGFDPDTNTEGTSFNQGPYAARNVTRGYDYNTLPITRNFTLGINIQF